MTDFAARYLWLLGIPVVVLYFRVLETRARVLVAAGRLTTGEAERLACYGRGTGLVVILAAVIAHLTNPSALAVCALYGDPLRPGALVAWVLIGTVTILPGCLALTPNGVRFLVRVWPALAVSQSLSREWKRSEVVWRALAGTWGVALIFGYMFWTAIARPEAWPC